MVEIPRMELESWMNCRHRPGHRLHARLLLWWDEDAGCSGSRVKPCSLGRLG